MEPPRPRNEDRGWSITVRAKSKGLDLRLSASNLFPHWGSGGGSERISFILRLRRRFFLRVESQNQRPGPQVPALRHAASGKPIQLAKRIFRRLRWFSLKKAAPRSESEGSKPGTSSAIAKQQGLVAAMAGILSLKKKEKNRLGILILAFASTMICRAGGDGSRPLPTTVLCLLFGLYAMESHIGICLSSICTVRSSLKQNLVPLPTTVSPLSPLFFPLPTRFDLSGILRAPICMASFLSTPGIVSFSVPKNHSFGEKFSIPQAADGSASVAGCFPWVLRAAKLGLPVQPLRASSNLYSAVEEGSRVLEEEEEPRRPLRVGIICGGPSAERGISLNSARSVLDHIQGEDLHVVCYYIDCNLNAYAISSAQLYSNTPADFDFKLESLAQGFHSLHAFVEHLAVSVDIVFPVIHGRFGEDGGIQELLEKANVPFVGTTSHVCRQAFDKYNASLELSRQGFVTVPSFLVQATQPNRDEMVHWFERNFLDKEKGKVVVKPTLAGSSIGVSVAYGIDDAIEKAVNIIKEGIDDKVLVEIFLEGGIEFTAIVIDVGMDNDVNPIVLLPTEVDLQILAKPDASEDVIFNYRRKYLPTQQVAYHTPPRFPIHVIECIRQGASMLFQSFGLRDFARIDGWFLPNHVNLIPTLGKDIKFGLTESGTILFTDINLVSGMEQTSFLFQQASKVGFSHSNILQTVIQHACSRSPSLKSRSSVWNTLARRLCSARFHNMPSKSQGRRKVFILFGGETSERQVSLMSGTNVWLNLQGYDDLDVIPCLLAPARGYASSQHEDVNQHENYRTVWTLPYSLVLRHTTEEVLAACIEAIEPDRASLTSRLRNNAMSELTEALSKQDWFTGFDITEELPTNYTLENWIQHAKEAQAIVFIAVHGGIGEDGTLQSLLESSGVPYTGPGPSASKVCMDKVQTSVSLSHLTNLGVLTIPKDVRSREELLISNLADTWQDLTVKLQSESLCIKPARDGCSTGVARLRSREDLKVYVNALQNSLPRLPANSLSKAHGVIEMPNPPPQSLVFEPFIETDEVIVSSKSVDNNARRLIWEERTGWIEVTVGVMGTRGEMHSLSPSITVKETGDILSLEEKFQGGTGINLTPPPATIISEEALEACKQRVEIIANTLGLEGFSRIDAFVNVHTGKVMVIEVNTVPGMTPSTVLIHQALTELPPIHPREFFRTVLNFALKRSN